MDKSGEIILAELQAVAEQRALRAANPMLAAAVVAVKAFQHQRFEKTYADLLASPRFGPAARFFLADLYGPQDYSQRDHQFARVMPLLSRTLPKELLQTLAKLARLHALSEQLDTKMAEAWIRRGFANVDRRMTADGLSITPSDYAWAWREVGTPEQRELQIQLTVEVGAALEKYTRLRLLRQTLHWMRGPAQAAGVGALQRFLEVGFDTFKEMNGASDFLTAVARRERANAESLFSGATADTVAAR